MTIGFPTVFLAMRLLLHAVAPKTYGPAGGYDIYTAMSAGVLYTFGFIVAATLGCTAGSVDLSEGMFRHLVITGRSRLALYLARIPAGLAIIVPLVAIGFTIVCAVCVFAAPTKLSYNGVTVPAGLSQSGLESWAADTRHRGHLRLHLRRTNHRGVGCDNPAGPTAARRSSSAARRTPVPASAAQTKAAAIEVAQQNYPDYQKQFRYPSDSLMIKTGLWLELEAAIGFIVGLGLGIAARPTHRRGDPDDRAGSHPDPDRHPNPDTPLHQRATRHRRRRHRPPRTRTATAGLRRRRPGLPITESTTTAICVILAWLIGWTALGAWRMTTRDA